MGLVPESRVSKGRKDVGRRKQIQSGERVFENGLTRNGSD